MRDMCMYPVEPDPVGPDASSISYTQAEWNSAHLSLLNPAEVTRESARKKRKTNGNGGTGCGTAACTGGGVVKGGPRGAQTVLGHRDACSYETQRSARTVEESGAYNCSEQTRHNRRSPGVNSMPASKEPVNVIAKSDYAPPTTKAPSPPRHLSKLERQLWKDLLAANEHLRSPSFATLVETYVAALARHRLANEIVAAEGLVIEGVTGTRVNPAVQIMQAAAGTIAALSVKLAISAPSRREAGRHTKAEPVKPSPNARGRGLRLA